MDGTNPSATAGAADRRIAHRRVGAAAIASFLALLLLAATRGPAQADPAAPATAPAATPTVQPQQTAPVDPYPGFRHHHDGRGPRGGGEPGFGGGGDGGGGGGGGVAPAPSTGGGSTT